MVDRPLLLSRVVSSGVERGSYKAQVGGSKPSPPNSTKE